MVFADAIVPYAQAGWPCILPVPPDVKHPPPVGFTGADGRDTDPATLVTWATEKADWSVALRMPDGVIGIDVDHYDKGTVQKRGGDQIAELEAKLGPLPATWVSSARPAPSGIRFFQVPPGRYRTKLGDSIEIIQRHHRYAVVWPSPHAAAGQSYGWHHTGTSTDTLASWEKIPEPAGLPKLPEAWVEFLREGATEAGPVSAAVGEGHALLRQIESDDREECAEVYRARLKAVDEIARSDTGSRHDVTTERTHHLVMLGAAGHPGVGPVLEGLREQWAVSTAGEDRADEFERMLITSARKAVTEWGTSQVDSDPCILGSAIEVAAPAPDLSALEQAAIEMLPASDRQIPTDGGVLPAGTVRLWSVREVIGAHAFDPNAGLDLTLAQAVLERMQPALRYADDADTWLRRGPELWETAGKDYAATVVAQVAQLMPAGSPEAEKGSEEASRADRRKRFMTSASAGAISTQMKALARDPGSPLRVRLSDLDSEPWLLWAGGQAWDLRSAIGTNRTPNALALDPGTPHLHAAAIAPEWIETPHWDAYLEAVLPDPELRAWAMRVLSIAVTGYPDAALPILLGDPGLGKTSLIKLIMSVLGTYAHAADARLLADGNSHASIVYALKGRRLSFIDEGPRRGRWATERLKQLTGGGELTGNRMRENPITFSPTHTLILTANDEPQLTDDGLRRRVRLIPCEGDAAEVRERRAALGPIGGPVWRREAPGILAELMRQAGLWLANPDSALTAAAPGSVRDLAEEIGREQDTVRTWVESETEPHPDGTKAMVLYESFTDWCRRLSIRDVPSMTVWGRKLNDLGYPGTRSMSTRLRPLRVVYGGGLGQLPIADRPEPAAVTSPLPTPTVPQDHDGLHDGFMTGLSPNPSCLSPAKTHDHDGYDGFTPYIPPTSPITPHRENLGERGVFPQPVMDDLQTGTSVQVSAPMTGLAQPVMPPEAPEPITESEAQPKKRGSKLTDEEKAVRKEAAAAKRREAAEAKRAAALAETSGSTVELPAVVDRQGNIRSVTVAEVLDVVRAAVARSGALSVDVETTGRPIGHREYALRTIQLGDLLESVYLDADDPVQAAAARELLAEAARVQAFSASADVNPLIVAKLTDEGLWDRMFDVVIPAKLADPSAAKGGADGLKDLSAGVLGPLAVAPAAEKAKNAMFQAGGWLTTKIKYDTPIEKIGWAQADKCSSTMVRYGGSDVLDTGALAVALPWPAPAVLERERTISAMVARIGLDGWRLDEPKVRDLVGLMEVKKADALTRAQAEGVANPGSPKQLATRLKELGAELPLTEKGNPSTDKKVIAKLEVTEGPWRPLVDALKDYREAQNRLGLFLGPWLDMCVNGDGRMRPTVYTLEARTGRMSCVRPNLQQVPKYGGYRSAVLADPGHVFISADFAGVEIRVAAALSQDEKLLAYITEEDQAPEDAKVGLHWAIAHQVWGPEATGKHRKTAKIGVFSTFYGSGADNLAGQLGISIETAQEVQKSLYRLIPGYKEYSDGLMRQAQAGNLALPSYSGRTLWLPRDRAYASGNTAVQGTARELLVDGMVEWRQTRWGRNPLLPVHDELIVMVREEEAEEATAELVCCMERDLFGVRIKVEASAPSPFWLDGD